MQSNGVSVLGTYAPCRTALRYCCMFSSVGLGFNHVSRPSSHGFILHIPLEKNTLYFQDLQFVKADLDFKSCHKIIIMIVVVV